MVLRVPSCFVLFLFVPCVGLSLQRSTERCCPALCLEFKIAGDA